MVPTLRSQLSRPRPNLTPPLVLALGLVTAACGGADDGGVRTCSGTASGAIVGTFTCELQATYAAGSILTLAASEGPMGTTSISIALRYASPFTVRSYAAEELQSAVGTLTAPAGVFVLDDGPGKGTASLALTRVDASRSTDQANHYGLSGSADATLVDSTGLTTSAVTLHVEF